MVEKSFPEIGITIRRERVRFKPGCVVASCWPMLWFHVVIDRFSPFNKKSSNSRRVQASFALLIIPPTPKYWMIVGEPPEPPMESAVVIIIIFLRLLITSLRRFPTYTWNIIRTRRIGPLSVAHLASFLVVTWLNERETGQTMRWSHKRKNIFVYSFACYPIIITRRLFFPTFESLCRFCLRIFGPSNWIKKKTWDAIGDKVRVFIESRHSTNAGQLTSAITVPSTRHDLSCFYLGTFRDGKKLKMKWPAHTCGESEVDEVSDVMLP